MISSDTFSLTDAEQTRFAHVQRLSAKGLHSVSELISMLTDSSWVVRRSVVSALADAGDEAVSPLVDLLQHGRDSEARIAAVVDTLSASKGAVEKRMAQLADHEDAAIVADVAQILGRRRASTAVPILVKLTKHVDDNVAVGAIEALGRIGGRAAVEALIDIIRGKNFFRVFPAIDVLGRSGDPRSVAPLAELLSSPTYLPEASRALGRSGEKAAAEPLVGLLGSPVDAVVRVAAHSIADLRDRYQEKSGGDALVMDVMIRNLVKPETTRRLSQVLSQSDTSEAVAVCSLLGIIADPQAAPALTLALEAESSVATAAAAALKKIGRDADATFLKALREGSSERRKILLPAVTRSSAAGEIAVCLHDPDPEVRALTCDLLARLGNASVVSEIFSLLEDKNLRVVHAATAALQALGSRETRELAAKSAASANAVVRRSALRILSYFGDASALGPLLNGLNDADARVQEAAIHGLPFVEDQQAYRALIASAQSDVPRIRALAMRALGQLPNGGDDVGQILRGGLKDGDPWTRYYACQSLGRLKLTAAAEEIASLLSDGAGQVRVAAVEALSHLDSVTAHEALRQAAESGDLEVRRTALVGLGMVKRNDDLPVLLRAGKSADIATRLMALSSISKFDSPEVFPALKLAALDSDEQVSTSAISFLGLRREQEATEILVQLLHVTALSEKAKTALLVASEGRAAGLLVALESADHEIAATLISMLSRLQRPEARAALLAAAKLSNVAARKAAAPALAARRDPEMMAILQEAAESDPDAEVRQICSILIRH